MGQRCVYGGGHLSHDVTRSLGHMTSFLNLWHFVPGSSLIHCFQYDTNSKEFNKHKHTRFDYMFYLHYGKNNIISNWQDSVNI